MYILKYTRAKQCDHTHSKFAQEMFLVYPFLILWVVGFIRGEVAEWFKAHAWKVCVQF